MKLDFKIFFHFKFSGSKNLQCQKIEDLTKDALLVQKYIRNPLLVNGCKVRTNEETSQPTWFS